VLEAFPRFRYSKGGEVYPLAGPSESISAPMSKQSFRRNHRLHYILLYIAVLPVIRLLREQNEISLPTFLL
jgi:hypothetical protein